MKLMAKNRAFFSFVLIFSMLMGLVYTPVEAAITREQMQKVVKWGTIGGVAISAVIGAATFGVGGLIIGAGIGALTTTLICDHFGIAPRDQWKQVFPNFKLPFKYNRQNQSGGLGTSIPVTNAAAAPALNQNRSSNVDKSLADKVRENYQKAYREYTDAVQKSKDSGLIKKALDAYKKAKAEFDKL